MKRIISKLLEIILNLRYHILYDGINRKDIIISYPVEITNKSQIKIGKHTEIGVNCFLDAKGGLSIGKNCRIARNVIIRTTDHDFRNSKKKPFDEEKILFMPLKICDNVWIGDSAKILPRVNFIGKNAIIGMGSVVAMKNVPENSIIAGNPAKIIGKRD